MSRFYPAVRIASAWEPRVSCPRAREKCGAHQSAVTPWTMGAAAAVLVAGHRNVVNMSMLRFTLLLFAGLPVASGDIVVISLATNSTRDVFLDLPATFGLAIPDEGILVRSYFLQYCLWSISWSLMYFSYEVSPSWVLSSDVGCLLIKAEQSFSFIDVTFVCFLKCDQSFRTHEWLFAFSIVETFDAHFSYGRKVNSVNNVGFPFKF